MAAARAPHGHVVSVRLTDAELERLRCRADATGRSMSEELREAIQRLPYAAVTVNGIRVA